MQDAERLGKPVPIVYQHPVLIDCLVIPPWLEGNSETSQPRHNVEVVVDAACGAAVLRGADVFAPGVMGLLPCKLLISFYFLLTEISLYL